jgi:hypothetical protein
MRKIGNTITDDGEDIEVYECERCLHRQKGFSLNDKLVCNSCGYVGDGVLIRDIK